MRRFLLGGLLCLLVLPVQAQPDTPILFATQVPNPSEWMTPTLPFGNHLGLIGKAVRGGDLYIRYPDGTLKNLTAAAGYGQVGFQGAGSIAVREPCVHWDGTKAVFSMVVGAPEVRYQHNPYTWQLYEITGLGQSQTPVITKVPHQPEAYNNVSPIYGSDDRIIFSTDKPRSEDPHLHPQLDEYESTQTVTGLWSLDPLSGDLFLLNHSPSGNFRPLLDSFGRVLSTKWDHLQQDQQNYPGFGAYNWTDESAGATPAGHSNEVFPEPRTMQPGSNINGHRIEVFLPWQMNEDGTDEEILNHLGRHELTSYATQSFTNDPDLFELLGEGYNPTRIRGTFQLKESPTVPGLYYGISSPTFYHHTSGRIFSMYAPPTQNADSVVVNWLTDEIDPAGQYRHPLPLSNGTLLAAYTTYTGTAQNLGTATAPRSPFRFRLRTLTAQGNGLWAADAFLTPGIHKPVNYWDPDDMVTYTDTVAMWEFDPVEVVARPRPPRRTTPLPAPEAQVFADENVDVGTLQAYMRANNLALVVSRNVTTRDDADRLQPYNLRVAGTATQTIGTNGLLYDVAHLQFYQGDLIRGYTGKSGRRTLAQPMHDDAGQNTLSGPGRVALATDGSMAAFVPARRAMTWELQAPNGDAVVRERMWVSFQPGEIRVCAGCHGANHSDQAGNPPAQNQPEALRQLLQSFAGQDQVTLSAHVFLDGAYTGGTLRTDLNTALLLPAHQPYTAGPWHYAGSEALPQTDLAPKNDYPDFFDTHPNIVDWVLLELWDAPNGTAQARRAALVTDDGSVVDLDGTSPVRFVGVAPAAYYVVARHRNHLAAMSTGPVDFSGGAGTYHFTSAGGYGTSPMRQLQAGVWTLWPGDGNGDGSVTAFDFLNVWLPQNGNPPAYTAADFNMDGAVSAFDFLQAWLPANGQATQVPD